MKLTKIVVGFAFALIAAAMVPSAKGQVSLPCCGMPTYTVKGAKVGTASDGTQFKTALWLANGSAGDWSYTRMTSVDAVTGVVVVTTTTFANGAVDVTAGWNGGPNQYGAERFIISGYPDNTGAVQTLNVQLWSAYGYAVTALVEHFDASGVNLLEPPVAITDPQLLLPSVSTRFTLGLDDPAATEVVVRNAGTDIANVTVAAYDAESTTSANRVPFATVTMQIPVGGKFGRFASEVFAGNDAFAAELAKYINAGYASFGQGVLTVSADQPISVNTVLFNTKSDGSLLSTVWFAFPSVPSILAINAVQGFNPSLPFPQCYEATNGILNQPGDSFLLLYGKFGASQGSVVVDGSALPASAITYWGPSQINVNLVGLPAFTVGNHSVLVIGGGMASAPCWFTATATQQ
jgi:hypothetical protein